MKRSREDGGDAAEFDSIATMATCLMLLSRGGDSFVSPCRDSPIRVFECKTCNRQFPSFQALGGHRASHKKPRLMGLQNPAGDLGMPVPSKPKTHECSICGVEFSIGQALGGHMRRHRAALSGETNRHPPLPVKGFEEASPPPRVPVVKRSNSRRVLCWDLNLTPLENDVDFGVMGRFIASCDKHDRSSTVSILQT
ncbi:zinc finger protein ZAT12-like [Malania oleifera]|uniref:zinc finger protein ZAT12-like n=1 Tax=Malania oleifera TaxID=397392 RepID=UPI0025AE8D38|nr:zinc finger protein ZAT12-like [Malania oleifera]